MNWPGGFVFSAGHCGIKRSGKPDLAFITLPRAEPLAAMFTTNRVQAAPVRLSRAHLGRNRGRVRALVVNSGNANCATGAAGRRAAQATAAAAARLLGCPREQVLVCSTGVIGVELDAAPIAAALAQWRDRQDGPEVAARAILTTDTRPKTAAAEFTHGRERWHVAGFAKGSGMIHPRMATMLAFLFTDVPASTGELRRLLRPAVEESFHRITVDGDTSTNDAVMLWSSGAGPRLPAAARPALVRAVTEVAQALARQIVLDGEGARRFVTVRLEGARTRADADRAARAIAHSPLVKTALAGADPNWGRVLCAAGYSGARFDPDRAEIWFNAMPVYRRGRALAFDEAAAKRELDRPEVAVRIHLHAGEAASWMWTCDLTEGYIRINASYRT